MPSQSLATMQPPGGRGSAPGGEIPPGGRSAPGGSLPRVAIGRQGRSMMRRPPRGPLSGSNRGVTTQRVTVKPDSSMRRQAQLAFRDHFRTSRPDLTNAGNAAAGNQQPAYNARGLGRKPASPRVANAGKAAAAAAAGNAAPPKQAANMPTPPAPIKKKQGKGKAKAAAAGLGSPGTPRRANPTQPLQAQSQQDVDDANDLDVQIQAKLAARNVQWQAIHQQLNNVGLGAPKSAKGLPAPGTGTSTP